jgi:hypothetical protein
MEPQSRLFVAGGTPTLSFSHRNRQTSPLFFLGYFLDVKGFTCSPCEWRRIIILVIRKGKWERGCIREKKPGIPLPSVSFFFYTTLYTTWNASTQERAHTCIRALLNILLSLLLQNTHVTAKKKKETQEVVRALLAAKSTSEGKRDI